MSMIKYFNLTHISDPDRYYDSGSEGNLEVRAMKGHSHYPSVVPRTRIAGGTYPFAEMQSTYFTGYSMPKTFFSIDMILRNK